LERCTKSATSVDRDPAVRAEREAPVPADLPGVSVRIGEVAAVAERELRAGLQQGATGGDRLVDRRVDRIAILDVDGQGDPAERAARRLDQLGVLGQVAPSEDAQVAVGRAEPGDLARDRGFSAGPAECLVEAARPLHVLDPDRDDADARGDGHQSPAAAPAGAVSFSMRIAVALNSAVPDFGSVASIVSRFVATSSWKWSVMNVRPGRRPSSILTGVSTAPRRDTTRTRSPSARPYVRASSGEMSSDSPRRKGDVWRPVVRRIGKSSSSLSTGGS